MVNREDILIWIHLVPWNVLDRHVVLPEGTTSAPLKFGLFCRNFFDFAKVRHICLR